MVGTFASILKGLDVRIVYNRGFDSITNANKTYQRIKKAWQQKKKVRIIYFGDLDPTGDNIDEVVNENMKVFFDVEQYTDDGYYHFKRIAILKEHIEKFNLPENPDESVSAKLKRDPRAKKFIQKYHRLFQIEIDALAAHAPTEFKEMVIDSIKQFYDNEIYGRVLYNGKHCEKTISKRIIKNVRIFLEEQKAKLLRNG